MARKCLVIQEARFGDLIQSKPLIEDLSMGGQCRRVLLVRSRVAEAARAMNLGEEVLVWPPFGNPDSALSPVERISQGRDFVAKLRGEGFERVVVLNHHGTGITLARLLGIPHFGFDRVFDKGNGEIDPLAEWPGYLVASSRGIRPLNRIHLSDIWRGFGENGRRTEKGPEDAGKSAQLNPRGPIVVVLGGRSPYRRWDREPLLKLVRALRKIDGGPVFLSGGPEDAVLGEHLARECGEGVVNTAGQTGYSELEGLLASAGAVVSPDTASLHLAASLGVPTLGLFFASALPFETGAYRSGALSLVSSMECYPCAGEGSSCSHRTCRDDPDPTIVAEIVSRIKRGASGRDLVMQLWGRLTGSELWEAEWTGSGLLQKVLSPRLLTKERVVSRLLRRFSWRYLAGSSDLLPLETEISWEGTDIAPEPECLPGFSRISLPWSLWFTRLEQGISLYARLREQDLRQLERKRLVDRLATDFPMLWPVLHHLEWVEGGRGPLDRLMAAAVPLALEASDSARLVYRSRGRISLEMERAHVEV